MKGRYSTLSKVFTVVFILLCIVWIMPIFEALINSFKSNDAINLNAFALPGGDSFVGFDNYAKGMTFGNYPFMKSVGFSFFITIASVVLILLFTSMSAWYIARVDSLFARIFYYLCLFSMIVPFQMVMFTLTFTADRLKLNTPWTIPIVYLGFGAGLAIFMFVGFVKSLPLEIEEAAAIDGCGPFRTFFLVVLPMLKPTLISVGILETMWVWNDYLLPYLVLDRTKSLSTSSARSTSSRAWPPAPSRAKAAAPLWVCLSVETTARRSSVSGCGEIFTERLLPAARKERDTQ